MSDILERLQKVQNGLFWPEARDAIAEIDRLRTALAAKEAETLERAAKVVETTAHEGLHESMWRNKFMAISSRIRALKEAKP